MIVEEEFVVHLFALGEGPGARAEYDQVRRLWEACRTGLGTIHPIGDEPYQDELAADPGSLPAGPVVAAAQSASTNDAERQVILRRRERVLNLSVAMAQPDREPTRTRRSWRPGTAPAPDQARSGWAQFAQLWEQIRGNDPAAVLGEHRIFAGSVSRRAALRSADMAESGEVLGLRLPAGPVRPRDWARRGTIASGFGLWDVGTPSSPRAPRELLIVGPSDRDADLSALIWSEGSSRMPALASYLLITSKVRYQAQLLQTWQASRSAADDSHPLPPGRPEREAILRRTRAELETMQRTCAIALDNLATWRSAIGAGQPGQGSIFAEDAAAAAFLQQRIDDELEYLRIDLGSVADAQRYAEAEFQKRERRPAIPPPALAPPSLEDNALPGKVFVVYAHENEAHRQAVLDLAGFLRGCGIDAELDRYFAAERRDWPMWARDQIIEAEFVLVVASPLCRGVLEKKFPARRNQGIRSELALLQELLLKDSQTWDGKILPVLLPPYGVDDIPLFLNPRAKDWYEVRHFTEPAAQDLLATLRRCPPIKRPPLGGPPREQRP